MNIIPRSLRQKVILGYIMGLVLMLGVVLVNWSNLRGVEKMVISGEKVSDIFDVTLEIRRYEKNYFLYGENEDYAELLIFVGKAEELIEKSSKELNLFSKPEVISGLGDNIKEYRELLEVLPSLHSMEGRRAWQEKLRDKGRAIVTATEEMSNTERKIIQATLYTSRNMLIASIIFLVSSGFIAGAIYYRMFIKPLRLLENHMNRVANGEFSFIPIEFRDRELVSLNKAFNKMLLELELRQIKFISKSEKLASLGTMASGIAHQLNNPLSNIFTSYQILIEEIEDSDIKYKKELLGQIEEQVGRAKNMIRSLLQFSREKEFKSEPVPLKDLLEDTIRLIQGDIPSKVEVQVKVPDTICITVDKQRIEQAFLNIIKNAIDAISEEGRIFISAEENIKNKIAEIKIRDTGPGIETENIGRIFDPFFTTKADGKGTGLGLFVTREIIEEHKGNIDVESKVGYGTTFTIKLPLTGQPSR